jgi:hypothetical protein
MGGSFLYSLTVTDVVTAWTECTALLFRDQHTTLDGLARIRNQMPVALTSFDTDNGTEFINEVVFAYCEKHGIKFTRSRPYKKNDQCFIEQKNGNVVRRNIGYDRFEGMASCRALNELYAVLRLYVNFFQPSVKLIEKTRQGSKTRRTYDTARTPYQRMMESAAVSAETKVRLKTEYIDLDPIDLLERLRVCQEALWKLAVGPPSARVSRLAEASQLSATAPASDSRPSAPLPPLSGGATTNEREVHWRKAKRSYIKSDRARNWRTREDPFQLVWEEVLAMLSASPSQPAKTILTELQQRYPGVFPTGQLRTLQRRVHRWRVDQTLVESRAPANLDAPSPALTDARA